MKFHKKILSNLNMDFLLERECYFKKFLKNEKYKNQCRSNV